MNILFLCTGNSVRSILAEAICNRNGAGRIAAFSAGSNPAGRVHPGALSLLRRRGLGTEGLRSKSWHEFAGPGAPELPLIVTVCSGVAGEIRPPRTRLARDAATRLHWEIEDPLSAPRDQMDLAFQVTYRQLSARIDALLTLPLEHMGPMALADHLGAVHAAE